MKTFLIIYLVGFVLNFIATKHIKDNSELKINNWRVIFTRMLFSMVWFVAIFIYLDYIEICKHTIGEWIDLINSKIPKPPKWL